MRVLLCATLHPGHEDTGSCHGLTSVHEISQGRDEVEAARSRPGDRQPGRRLETFQPKPQAPVRPVRSQHTPPSATGLTMGLGQMPNRFLLPSFRPAQLPSCHLLKTRHQAHGSGSGLAIERFGGRASERKSRSD